MSYSVRVRNLAKVYRVNVGTERDGVSLRDSLVNTLKGTFQRLRQGATHSLHTEDFWALKDVDFDVYPGQILGIIGRNGAGKSTLLKVLSQITDPTSGRAEIRGRSASLLEVGTGFHPELTGRENVYLNGAILGMTKGEIDRKFDDITSFAGIPKFIDTPVKRYSSGMRVRLGFAVASQLEPDVLIIDEVLAVGDAEFQDRCLHKMHDVARGGRTVLFVSHNMASIRSLCERVIWLDEGQIAGDGDPADVIDDYISANVEMLPSPEMNLEQWPNRLGNGGARVLSARLIDCDGNVQSMFRRNEPLTVEFRFQNDSGSRLHLAAVCSARDGTPVLHLSQFDSPTLRELAPFNGQATVRLSIPELPLFAGEYYWDLHVQTDHLQTLDAVEGVLPFRAEDMVNSPRPFRSKQRYGLVSVPAQWELERH